MMMMSCLQITISARKRLCWQRLMPCCEQANEKAQMVVARTDRAVLKLPSPVSAPGSLSVQGPVAAYS